MQISSSHAPAPEFSTRCSEKGVIVRPMNGFGLTEHVRISIGLPEENERLIKAIAEIRGERSEGTRREFTAL